MFVLRWVIPFPDASSSLMLDSSPVATSFGAISIKIDGDSYF